MGNPQARSTLKKFRVIISAMRRHYRDLEAASGVSGAQVWMLACIAETPGLTVSALSQALAIHLSTTSNLLDKLARAGLVDRLRSDDDRRVVRLQLTEAGQAVVERAPRPLNGLVLHALEQMSGEELRKLDEDLAMLIERMNVRDEDQGDQPLSNLV